MRFWIILIIALVCFISCTDDKVQSAELNHRSSEQLLELAHQYIQKHDADSAMMCYSIVANRYSPDMNPKDLVLGSKAFNGLGFCYYFFYQDIPSAYDALMQAKDICKTKIHIPKPRYVLTWRPYIINIRILVSPKNRNHKLWNICVKALIIHWHVVIGEYF